MCLHRSDRDRSSTPSGGTAVATVATDSLVLIRERGLRGGPRDSLPSLLEINDLPSSSLKKVCYGGGQDELAARLRHVTGQNHALRLADQLDSEYYRPLTVEEFRS